MKIARIRTPILLVLLIGLLVACMPNDAGAASGLPRITTSTYQSGQWCDADDSESVCAFKATGTFTLLEVDGLHFTHNGYGLVTVTNLMNMSTVSSGLAKADSSGKIAFRTQDVEVCAKGTPLMVQVYDVAKQTYSNTVMISACRF